MVGLGHAGLTPFYFFAGLSWWPDPAIQSVARHGFAVYALVILVFLAGSLWGSANVREGADKISRLLVSNLLAVLGAAVLIIFDPLAAAACLLVLHLLQLWYETAQTEAGWYISLRKRLTCLSVPAYLLLALGQVRL